MNLPLKSKFVILVSIVILTITFSTYKYVYKPNKSIESRKNDFKGKAGDFLLKTTNDDAYRWLNKTIEIRGKITSLDSKGLLLNDNIYCQLKEGSKISLLQKNQTIIVKGTVIGYDDLLEELKLNQCIIKE